MKQTKQIEKTVEILVEMPDFSLRAQIQTTNAVTATSRTKRSSNLATTSSVEGRKYE